MTRLLEAKSALVTGGASGIGRATALAMAREGARVAVADRTEDLAAATVALINQAGGQAIAIGCDVASSMWGGCNPPPSLTSPPRHVMAGTSSAMTRRALTKPGYRAGGNRHSRRATARIASGSFTRGRTLGSRTARSNASNPIALPLGVSMQVHVPVQGARPQPG